MDPRSPSGIPRTPIIIEGNDDAATSNEEGAASTSTPIRGCAAKHKKKPTLLSKLAFNSPSKNRNKENSTPSKNEVSKGNDKQSPEKPLLDSSPVLASEDEDKREPLSMKENTLDGNKSLII